MVTPICAPIRSTRSGSNVAPQHSGDGYTVACQAASPVRHSSCTRAGIPSRPAATIWRWVSATARAPSAGVDRRGAEGPGELPEAVPDQLVPADRRRGQVVLVRRDLAAGRVHAHPDAVELGHLLLPWSAGPAGRLPVRPGLADGSRQVPVTRLCSMVTCSPVHSLVGRVWGRG